MRIVTITMVRNEADVVEAFARHHLGFVDHMVFVDHRSIDSTNDILQQLTQEGAPIEVLRESRLELVQAELTTLHMRRAARKLGADWILPLDVDEFVTTDETTNPRACLEKLDPNEVHSMPWRSYIPHPQDDPNEPNVLERIQHRRAVEPIQYVKVVVPGAMGAYSATHLEMGNHILRRGYQRGKRGARGKKIKALPAEGLHLAHFPVRSVEQLAGKVLLGWPARQASPEQSGGANYHLEKLFEKLVEGRELTRADLQHIGATYALPETALETRCSESVHDPVRSPGGPFQLRYSSGRYDTDVARAVAELAQDLCRRLADERRPWQRLWRALTSAGTPGSR